MSTPFPYGILVLPLSVKLVLCEYTTLSGVDSYMLFDNKRRIRQILYQLTTFVFNIGTNYVKSYIRLFYVYFWYCMCSTPISLDISMFLFFLLFLEIHPFFRNDTYSIRDTVSLFFISFYHIIFCLLSYLSHFPFVSLLFVIWI